VVPPALSVRGLSKTFAGSTALADLDLDIAAGEVHALLGQNGSGKSTFIKILSGYHVPDAGGSVRVAGESLPFGSAESSQKLGMRFVHQDLALVDVLPVADNMSLGPGYPQTMGTVRSRRLRCAVRRDLQVVGLHMDPGAAVGSLAPSERTGVAIARAIKELPDSEIKVLVLDEPTATLPHDEVARLLSIIRAVAQRGVGVLYVSHHLDETLSIADTVTVLKDGRRVRVWSRAQVSHDALVSALAGDTALGESGPRPRRPPPDSPVPSKPLLVVRGLRAGVIQGFDLSARAGEIVGIAGVTGSGRDALLPAIYGAAARQGGEVAVEGQRVSRPRPGHAMRAGMAYVPSDRKNNAVFGDLSARENLTISDVSAFWKFPALRRQLELTEVARWFDSLSIRPASRHDLPLSVYSGGNQQKVILARWLRRNAKVLLLDEPTEGVDVGAQAMIHHHILSAAARGSAVLISSVNIEELEKLCDRVVVLNRGRVVTTLTGESLSAAAILAAS
jgi:ribose transport system ATP-binding protein